MFFVKMSEGEKLQVTFLCHCCFTSENFVTFAKTKLLKLITFAANKFSSHEVKKCVVVYHIKLFSQCSYLFCFEQQL